MLPLVPGGKRLGLGLIGIGRPWGHVPGEVPTELAARDFLAYAFQSGVRYFDTAPSYGSSEERFGRFLASLTPAERTSVTVATKFGEHWDDTRNEPFVDHSYDALARSLERSASRLGRIDVLQLHKTTPEVLRSHDLARAWQFAASLGIQTLGPSVSDLDSARAACASGAYQMLQLPLNVLDDRFLPSSPKSNPPASGSPSIAPSPWAAHSTDTKPSATSSSSLSPVLSSAAPSPHTISPQTSTPSAAPTNATSCLRSPPFEPSPVSSQAPPAAACPREIESPPWMFRSP